ncbi:Cyclin-dependent protein kinase inhibitor SMR15 [Linum grandiflorum]
MGFSGEKSQSQPAGKWVLSAAAAGDDDEAYGSPATPRSEGAAIPARLTCPPPPRKRRAAAVKRNCNGGGGGGEREFFNPPELESFFSRHGRRAG